MRCGRLVVSIISAIVLFFAGSARAQDGEGRLPSPPRPLPQYSFDRFGIADGLPADQISEVVQDRRGYLWIGTEGGLVRYDGQDMRTYRPVPKGGGQALKNIRTIHEDATGNVWAGGMNGGGLARFDQSTRSWRHYRHDPSDSLTLSSDWLVKVDEAKPGRMLALTLASDDDQSGYCLDLLNAETGHARRYRLQRGGSIGSEGSCFVIANPERFDPFHHDESGTVWISTDQGLLEYDPAADTLIHHRPALLNPYGDAGHARLEKAIQEIPPLAAISSLGSEEDRTESFKIESPQDVLFVGLGEMPAHTRHDYGWLEDGDGEIVWEMTLEESAWAGGQLRNRLVVARATLPAGRYRLRFVTDVGHSPGEGWATQPPDSPGLYGVHVLPVTDKARTPTETRPSVSLNDTPPWMVLGTFRGPGGDLLIGTRAGLHRFDLQSRTFSRMEMQGADGSVLNRSLILTIYKDQKENFWIGTYGDGLFRVDFERSTVRRYEMPDTPSNFYPFTAEERKDLRNRIYQIVEETDGTFWLRWFLGLHHFDPRSGEVRIYEHEQTSNHTLGEGNISRMLRDRHGTMWVGTRGGGLARLNRTRDRFRLLFDATEEAGGRDAQAFRLTEAEDGMLWTIAATGVYRIDDETGGITRFGTEESPDHPGPLPGRWPLSVYFDRSDRLWVGTNTSLALFDPKSGIAERYDVSRLENESLAGAPSDMLEDSKGRFWIGTFGDGLHRLDRGSGLFERYPYRERFSRAGVSDTLDSDEVNVIYEDRGGTLWIGTGGGLNRFDPETSTFTSFYDEAKGIADVQVIFEDSAGRLWLGAEYGLLRFDRQTGNVKRYDEESGLVHEHIGGILEDDNGHLWLNTQRGIVRFDPDRETFRTFDADDGLPGIDFAFGAHRMRNGRMVFGGRDGLLDFDPSELAPDLTPPSAVVEHVMYRGADGEVDVPTFGLNQARLAHDQNDVTVHYAGIDFGRSADVQYRYRLNGLDADWVDGGTQRTARYPALASGDYSFEVQAMSADGVWSASALLPLTVLPPWWRSWLAYVFYGLLFLGGIFAVDRLQRRRLMQREREKARERELEQAKEIEHAYEELEAAYRGLKQAQAQLVQQEKMASLGQLTAGIAHEIKNPLNFVTNFAGLSKELCEEIREAQKSGDLDTADVITRDLITNVERIEEHGRRADSIVRSMMQHARGTSGERELVDLKAFVEEYVNLAYHGKRASTPDFNADIERDLADDLGKIELVPQDIGRVLLNLLGNAFDAVYESSAKLDEEYKPLVRVSARRTTEGVELRVADNGPGISESIQNKVFEPFFTTKPTGSGTGLGLSLSYDIVTQGHGGSLEIESGDGDGAIFVAWLPARAPAGDGGSDNGTINVEASQ